MKKLFLSAALLVAFSLTSFASEKKVEDQLISFEMSTDLSSPSNADVLVGQSLSECETSTIRWTSAESDGEGGMTLTFHKATLVTCDDGFAAIVP